MKPFTRILTVFMVLSFIGIAPMSIAPASEGSCYLKASKTDVFVIVHNLSRNGDRGYRIWQGRLNQGDAVRINANYGRIRYYYNIEPDEKNAMSGGKNRWCDNDKTIGVP